MKPQMICFYMTLFKTGGINKLAMDNRKRIVPTAPTIDTAMG